MQRIACKRRKLEDHFFEDREQITHNGKPNIRTESINRELQCICEMANEHLDEFGSMLIDWNNS